MGLCGMWLWVYTTLTEFSKGSQPRSWVTTVLFQFQIGVTILELNEWSYTAAKGELSNGNQPPNLDSWTHSFAHRKTCNLSSNSICFAFTRYGAGHQMQRSVVTNIQTTLENVVSVSEKQNIRIHTSIQLKKTLLKQLYPQHFSKITIANPFYITVTYDMSAPIPQKCYLTKIESQTHPHL